MTTTQPAPFHRERRVQLLVAGGLIMIVALAAFAPHHERALFVDEGGSAKAFGAIALPPPVVGTLARFGWVGGDVLARVFAPALPRGRVASRQIAGGDFSPVDEFVAALAPAAPLPLTGEARALAGPEDGGSFRIASPGLPGNSARGGLAPGGGTGAGGGGGTPAAEPLPIPTPTLTPTPAASPTPAAMPTPAPAASPTLSPIPAPSPEPMPSPVPTSEPVPPPIVTNPAPSPVASPTADPTPMPIVTPEPIALPTPTIDPEPFPTPAPIPIPGPVVVPEPVGAVPEPSTWAMLILGFALVGAGLRRSARRRGARRA